MEEGKRTINGEGAAIRQAREGAARQAGEAATAWLRRIWCLTCFDLVGPMYYIKCGSWQHVTMHRGSRAGMHPMKSLP
jgi:hypothetical protein